MPVPSSDLFAECFLPCHTHLEHPSLSPPVYPLTQSLQPFPVFSVCAPPQDTALLPYPAPASSSLSACPACVWGSLQSVAVPIPVQATPQLWPGHSGSFCLHSYALHCWKADLPELLLSLSAGPGCPAYIRCTCKPSQLSFVQASLFTPSRPH